MKLWELRPLDKYRERDDPGQMDQDNPWDPWYDKAFGFIVRAETEERAREIANENAGDENNERIGIDKHIKTPWLNPRYSTCGELMPDGMEGLIMGDFHAA